MSTARDGAGSWGGGGHGNTLLMLMDLSCTALIFFLTPRRTLALSKRS